MSRLIDWVVCLHKLASSIFHQIDFIGPVAIRAYLAPVFFMAGMHKLQGFENIVIWFDEGLGLPFPTLMAFLATFAELGGAICLVFGFAVRYMAVPMAFTMIVAALTVHWEFGWQSIADPGGLFVNERVLASADKLDRATSILQQHGNYDWLKSSGKFVVLNNGIEWAVTYLVMCLSLITTGGGRWFSVDYWIKVKVLSRCEKVK